MPPTWDDAGDAAGPRHQDPARPRGRLYRLARSGQGFMTGIALGVLWALWIIRRRRPGPDLLGPATRAG